ncbi:hypothetical protein RF11_11335 [Thelohanellus kitauei]|uniref:Uncharacterized protein n=1 Tax=Thelohanellus kitauei TaxID=669202 RepID=A0A0C2IMK1_THEKT|nr:hypothetical protein RF11_11335 [Thelohanellus kitauei]
MGRPPSGAEIHELSKHIHHLIGIVQDFETSIRNEHERRIESPTEMEFREPGTFGHVSEIQSEGPPPSGSEIKDLSKNIHSLVGTVNDIKALIRQKLKHKKDPFNKMEYRKQRTPGFSQRLTTTGPSPSGQEIEDLSRNIQGLVSTAEDIMALIVCGIFTKS